MILMTDWKMVVKKKIIYPLNKFTDRYSKYQRFFINLGFNPIIKQKKVLISYITAPFEMDFNINRIKHPSNLEVAIIIKTFIDLGYCVDVIHCRNTTKLDELRHRKYDIIFGLGEPFYVACKNNPNAVKIVYLTESAPGFSRQMETERIKYYYDRHKKRVPLKRTGAYFKDEHIKQADFGILIGNEFIAKNYKKFYPSLKIVTVPTTGIYNDFFVFDEFGKIDSNVFVWFGSHGIVHKGLDVLVDAFKAIPEATLLICGMDKAEEKYLGNYKKYKNIINKGFINVQSEEFIQIAKSACYVILTSCSEGMATSVITCMRHGLIPIVTKQCGITVEGIGYYCEDYHVEYLNTLIKNLINEPQERLHKSRQRCYEQANEEYTLSKFEENFKACIKKIYTML